LKSEPHRVTVPMSTFGLNNGFWRILSVCASEWRDIPFYAFLQINFQNVTACHFQQLVVRNTSHRARAHCRVVAPAWGTCEGNGSLDWLEEFLSTGIQLARFLRSQMPRSNTRERTVQRSPHSLVSPSQCVSHSACDSQFATVLRGVGRSGHSGRTLG
jgi:hypothetical protein